MQIVIDIPESVIEHLKDGSFGARIKDKVTLVDAVMNGVPLPKGHGRLIDASQLLTVTECRKDGTEYCYVPYAHIEDAPTVIEANR